MLNRALALERIEMSGSPLQNAVFTRYFATTRVAVCGIVAAIEVCRSWIRSLAAAGMDRTARAIDMSDDESQYASATVYSIVPRTKPGTSWIMAAPQPRASTSPAVAT